MSKNSKSWPLPSDDYLQAKKIAELLERTYIFKIEMRHKDKIEENTYMGKLEWNNL